VGCFWRRENTPGPEAIEIEKYPGRELKGLSEEV
jgi:hypothetical protein